MKNLICINLKPNDVGGKTQDEVLGERAVTIAPEGQIEGENVRIKT